MNSNCAHSVNLDDDSVTENPSFYKNSVALYLRSLSNNQFMLYNFATLLSCSSSRDDVKNKENWVPVSIFAC